MSGAGRSARREYERRLRLDRDRRRAEAASLLARLVLGASATFLIVRVGIGLLGEVVAHHYELPLTTRPRERTPGLSHERGLSDAIGAVTALAVVARGVRALCSRRDSTEAWRRGAEGEEEVGAVLDRLAGRGVTVRHDLAIPGSRANVDHVVLTGSALFVIDTKNYRGTISLSGSRLFHGTREITSMLSSSCWQAERVARMLHAEQSDLVQPVVCVIGAGLPARCLHLEGVIVIEGTAELVREIRRRPRSGLAEGELSRIREALEEAEPRC